MDDKRFRNYINEIELGMSCKDFLEENKNLLKKIWNDIKVKREFEIFNALGHELRYKIFKILEKKPMCVCALARVFEKSDSTITYHLNILQNAGLIIGTKKGYFTIYYTKDQLISEIAEVV